MKTSIFDRYKTILSGITVVASLTFVGYELKKNNDYAIYQSQQELISMNIAMKGWLTDPDVVDILMNEDFKNMSPKDKLIFDAMVGSWFDLYETAVIAKDRGILTDDQYRAWTNGMCSLPDHWFIAFETENYAEVYVTPLVEAVKKCSD